MPAFLNRVFKRENSKRHGQPQAPVPTGPNWTDGWMRTEVAPEEVQELLRVCTAEVKSRGLSTPFLLLPYRPNTDPCAAKAFIRKFFDPKGTPPTGAELQQELRLTDPDVLCSALKWVWSRLPGGVVTWEVYELFRQGEVDSSMARDAFATFIPISTESKARSDIIFDYFDLLSAIAANGKRNGLGGLKLSRLAGWWAFEHTDTGYGFEGGYTSWTSSADATCHLFFAYMRSLSPQDPSRSVSLLPTSLRALLASVDYPPVTPPQLQTRTVRVVITVEKVSPSPFALLRRAKNLQYHHHSDLALKVFTDYDDPIRALSDECRRVLKCISSTGASLNKTSTGLQEASWSRFQDIGFTALTEQDSDSDDDVLQSETFRRRVSSQTNENPEPSTSRGDEDFMDIARPTTPSWADFMDAGFGDREISSSPAPHLLPPDKMLPAIETSDRLKSSQSNRRMQLLEPGELDSITPMEVDDVFWWVWMSSLAGEETPIRKAVFGRCALVETTVQGAKWLVVEEKIRGAAVLSEAPASGKKDRKWAKIAMLRRKEVGVSDAPPQQLSLKQFNAAMHASSRTNIGPDQTAKIQAAAAALRQQQNDSEYRRRPRENQSDGKTHSVFTLQPVVMSEATPAMKWANKYDRDNVRETYLNGSSPPSEKKPAVDTERSLPPLPKEESVPAPAALKAPAPPKSPAPQVAVAPPPQAPTPPPASTTPPPAAPRNVAPIKSMLEVDPAPSANSGRSSPSAPVVKRVSVSPTPTSSSTGSIPDKSKKVSRLRAIFGMKAEAGMHPTLGPQLSVPSNDFNRQSSMRKKHSPIEVKPGVTPPVTSEHPRTEKSIIPANLPPPPPEDQHPALAKHFSAFDQGPLDDFPAFVPDDISEMSENVSSLNVGESVKDDEPVSEPSPVNTPEPAQERWAQIKKNAAERAKAKAQDDAPTDTRGSADEEETSGEETIESRVARIKARVAQLTAEGATNNRA